MKDYYSILDISPDANQDQTRESYRMLVRIFHPDRLYHASDRAYGNERLKEINEAYEILSNPEQRQAYDEQRRATQSPVQAGEEIIAKQIALYHLEERLTALGVRKRELYDEQAFERDRLMSVTIDAWERNHFAGEVKDPGSLAKRIAWPVSLMLFLFVTVIY